MDGKMQPPSGVGGMGGRKRQNLTLDLNSASPKKNKVQNLLTSPDVQMLKLTSPELEKFLSQNPSLATPTPRRRPILWSPSAPVRRVSRSTSQLSTFPYL